VPDLDDARLAAALAFLSRANRALVRAEDEAGVLRALVDTAVQVGGFQLAWAGTPDDDGWLRPVAHAGASTAYLDDLPVSVHPTSSVGHGASGRAWREGRTVVVDDLAAEPTQAPWWTRAAAAGLASSAAVPLQRAGATVALLNLYGSRTGEFTAAIREVLDTLAHDASFALDALATMRARRSADERFRRIVQASGDAVFVLDRAGCLAEATGAWSDTLGPSATDALGRPAAELFAATEPGSDVASALDHAAQDGIGTFVWRDDRRDPPRFVQVRLGALHDERGALEGWVGIGRDISDLLQRQAQLARLNRALEQSPSAVAVVDPDGRLVYANPKYSHLRGLTLPEAIGRRLPEDASGTDAALTRRAWQAARDGRVWRGELTARGADGRVRRESVAIAPVRDASGQARDLVWVSEDLSEAHRLRAHVDYLERHDPLTGLTNRDGFTERLRAALGRADARPVSVAAFDLKGFQRINQSHGIDVGDAVLRAVAQRTAQVLPAGDLAARFGGDAFYLLLHPGADGTVDRLLTTLRDALAVPMPTPQGPIVLSVAIGVTSGRPGATAEDLLGEVDAALGRAKATSDRATVRFAPSLNEAARTYVKLESGLHEGLATGAFRIVAQPRVRLDTGAVVGAEVLLRWTHPELGPIPPARFVPIAEANGFIAELGAWVLDATARLQRTWRDAGHDLLLTANVSAHQLLPGELAATVAAALARHGVAPDRLAIEITETALMEDVATAVVALREVQALGVGVEIDDFGTGYASLAYLRRLPLDRLKVDRSFVADLDADSDAIRESTAIVRAVLGLAAGLGLDVVAEGVETAAQHRTLLALGCRVAQGYRWSRPVETDAFPFGPLRPNASPGDG
jgi:diguanylate cyclase (GGDEF)-like protein/PAS domain S-box-containing protein